MTAPSPDAAQPPVPHRPMPTLGRGVHWPDIMAKIEAERRDQPAPAGALDHARRQLGLRPGLPRVYPSAPIPLGNDAGGESGGPPVDLRDALRTEIHNVLGGPPTCDHGTASGMYCWPCTQRDRGTELRAYAAPVEVPLGDEPGDPDALAATKQQLGIVGDIPSGDILVPAGQSMPALAPVSHQHIWSITSPMRCVDCGRYLRPWWRRALDRIRRSQP